MNKDISGCPYCAGKRTEWDENGRIMEEQYYKMGELKDWKITTIRKLSD